VDHTGQATCQYWYTKRRAVAAEGTVERECAVLMAVLNLAVDMEAVDKNRLRRLPTPQYVKRERVAQAWELKRIREAASSDVWRMVILATQIGLRENKLIEIHEEWLVERGGAWWLVPAPGQTRVKGVPKVVPLNRLALDALHGNGPPIGGRFFAQWKDANSFKHRWLSTCERAGVQDLHFHDLRHTFATWLMQAGVDYVVIEKLLGHRLPGTGELYLHDWDGRLREAVNRLESFTRAVLNEESASQVPLTASHCHFPSTKELSTPRNMVPRDRIELSTPAFSGLCSTN
jgi:integrase